MRQPTQPRRLFFTHPTLPGEPTGPWWSARYIVAVNDLPEPTSSNGDRADATVLAEIVYDVDPVDSGLDEYRWRPNQIREVLELTVADLLREVQTRSDAFTVAEDATRDAIEHGDLEDTDETANQTLTFRIARDQYRIAVGLPRHVVRSDVYDLATATRAPLYALRHPWPAGLFMQGGHAGRQVVATPEHLADPEVRTVTNPEGTTLALLRDRVFLEAFPPDIPGSPGGFMRAQGASFADAEDALWGQWVKKETCPSVKATGEHRWETRGYKNGAGFCADCDIFGSRVFDVAVVGDPCVVCGTRTWHHHVGEVGGEARTDGTRNRRRCSRPVCPDHAPPLEWDVADLLGDAVRYEAADSGGPSAFSNLDTTWFTRFLPTEAANMPLTQIEHRHLSAAVADGRARLVDETIAGRYDQAVLRELTTAWKSAAEQARS